MGKFPKIVAYITLVSIGLCIAFSIFALTGAGQPQRLKRGIYFIDKVPIVYQLTESKDGTLHVNDRNGDLPQTYNMVYEVVTSDGKCHVVVMPNAIK